MENLQEYIVKEFGSNITQEEYIRKAEEGFWPAEEIVIKQYFKPGSKILDIGCGTGRTTIPLFKLGFDVIGVDITPNMISNAKKIAKSKKLNIKYEVGDATKLRFRDSIFDGAIFSNNGWTQIPGNEKRLRALKEIYRILKPGGYFIFTTHIRKMGGFTLFWIKQWTRFYILKHLGFKINEVDFGDRFFERESSGAAFEQKQYIHIPNTREVKEQIQRSGLRLIRMESGSKIANTEKYVPMFWICQR